LAAFYMWKVECSRTAQNTTNPIREIVDKLDLKNLPHGKTFIPLSIGDPSKFGNLPVPKAATDALLEAIASGDHNGYEASFGTHEARVAIANRYNEVSGISRYNESDVFIGSGCSDAINLAMCALLDKGDNILLPNPGFSLYITVCGRYGFEGRRYNLIPERQWEVDLGHLESQIDKRTKAILINNPSNPCGSVFSKKHLQNICKLAYKYQIPIIADEIYAGMVFENVEFVSCASVTDGPVLIMGGLAKQYLAPGWRVGWIVMHDPEGKMEQVRNGIVSLTQVILGANSLVQAAIPPLLKNVKSDYFKNLNRTLSLSANIMYNGFCKIPQLHPVKPQGAMYMMVEILVDQLEGINNDLEFCQVLLREEAVMGLPGSIFGSPNFFRVVLCPPPEQLRRALKRIAAFCENHALNESHI